MNWFLNSKMKFRLPAPPATESERQRIVDFLKAEGYSDILDQNHIISARRGSFVKIIFGTDPRCIPHRIRIEGDCVFYKIFSCFLWLKESDYDVFRTEARMLAGVIKNNSIEGPSMAEVQKCRLKADRVQIAIMLGVFVLSLTAMLLISKEIAKRQVPVAKPIPAPMRTITTPTKPHTNIPHPTLSTTNKPTRAFPHSHARGTNRLHRR